ncbi:fructose 1,6-bisphosphatase [Fervidicella metallireducens AeB]|uniref:Fructose-1,6-bisphosphatase n=1 Tax=Fervidicella metallireducens AeB TaxID=1403537 RepID=A0A017RX91_9CLOT|nr:class II fructose-bisphosphatase [Fervidicella metallireducens]EYE89201.1 fructose 1,6-bisphosphatase [Fervidicella metallireducens AeB]
MEKFDIAMGIVRVSEAAALSCSKLLGKGSSEIVDKAAVDGIRHAFDLLPIKGRVVIGECELNKSSILYIGEKVGMWEDGQKEFDIALDPVDGSILVAKGRPNAISAIAVAEKGKIFRSPQIYMQKIVVGPRGKGAIDINKSLKENIVSVADKLEKDIADITVMIQDRPRHEKLIKEAREIGVRVKIFGEGDIAAALATVFEDTGVDMLVGIGGAPEGVLAAAALKCLDGEIQAKLLPENERQLAMCKRAGIEDINKVLTADDLIMTDDVYFAATAISDCDLLKGVTYKNDIAITHSVVMRSSNGVTRFVDATHKLEKSMIHIKDEI